MRKAFVLLVLICLLLCSCGGTVSREAYEKVIAERDALAKELEENSQNILDYGNKSDLDSLLDEAPSSETVSSDRVYALGETATNEVFSLTVLDWMETTRVDDGSYRYYQADPGKEYLIVFVDLENLTTEDQNFYPLSEFEFFADDYTCRTTSFGSGYGVTINGIDPFYSGGLGGTEIAAGKKMQNYIAAEVPEDWSTIELVFQDNITFSFSKE